MKSYRLFNTEKELLEKLENDRAIVRIGERKICLVHHKGKYLAFDNLCPHNRHPLLEGHINYNNEVVCPLHAYRFNVTTGEECEQRTDHLTIHNLRIETKGIFLDVKN